MTWSYLTLHKETETPSVICKAYNVVCAVNSDGHEFAYDDKEARGWESTPTEVNSDAWFSFKLTGTGGGWFDGWMVQLRYVDENNYLAVGWTFGSLYLVERVNGTETYLVTRSVVPELNVWYDIHAQLDGDAVVLYWGERGAVPQRIEQSTDMPASTSRLRVRVNGELPWAFDDFRVMSRSLSGASPYIFTYGPANQLASMTTAGVTSDFTYDAWGRLATRAQGAYSAAYNYRYGSRLYQATSNFPGESNVIYDYGGDGKRRWRVDAYETRRYRHDHGWNVIHEEDGNGNTLSTNFFEPGQAVGQRLALSTGMATGYQVYAYHDHLGTVRHWRLPTRASARAYEYEPYGNPYAGSGFFTLPRIHALHEFDTALQQFRAPWRDYSPAMARWTTPDPLGMVDGPNVFAYVGGDPVNRYDLLGLFWGEVICGGICSIAVAKPVALCIATCTAWLRTPKVCTTLCIGGGGAACSAICYCILNPKDCDIGWPRCPPPSDQDPADMWGPGEPDWWEAKYA